MSTFSLSNASLRVDSGVCPLIIPITRPVVHVCVCMAWHGIGLHVCVCMAWHGLACVCVHGMAWACVCVCVHGMAWHVRV